MYEILKAIAEEEEFPFMYARKDFQNLFDEVETKNKSHIFLDVVEEEEVLNDNNIAEAIIYSGRFMVVYSSDIDEVDYETRYLNYIKPILDGDLKTIKEAIRCNYEVKINLWKKIEIINFLDYNFDGIIVNFNITLDL